jgi:predicted N-formylglutamate amidohydrolase
VEICAPACLLTCEHGGNRIPGRYAALFSRHQALLASHRGWDPGALTLARFLATGLHGRLFFSTISRLLVDLNRSPHHPHLLSRVSRALPEVERERILARWYRPYRERVEKDLQREVKRGRTIVHLSVHSFTPVLNGKMREVEVGVLYDPSRSLERWLGLNMVRDLQARLSHMGHGLRVRCNQPYRGTSDGFTTFLRRRFPETRYAGIELEVSQTVLLGGRGGREAVRKALIESLAKVLDDR